MAGYSKRSLIQKLGIKSGMRIIFFREPKDYAKILGELPENVTQVSQVRAPLDFIQFFTTSTQELERIFPKLAKAIAPNGMIWISWPKGSWKTETDLKEDIVREIGLQNGMVDVKVCAVDEMWSGLKFMFRLKDRNNRMNEFDET